MDGLKAEIFRTKSEIQTTEQQLAKMMKDRTVNLGRLIEINRKLKELIAYLSGLEFQSNRRDVIKQVNP